jgi:hypothetical protein
LIFAIVHLVSIAKWNAWIRKQISRSSRESKEKMVIIFRVIY